MKGTKILNHTEVNRKIQRMAYQIWERNFTKQGIVLVGIKENGLNLASALGEHLRTISGMQIDVFYLDINKAAPLQNSVKSNFKSDELNGRALILVDDVQNSGKTAIYAFQYFLQFELDALQFAVLVDRSHNSFPVRADFVGLSLSTTLKDHVEVTHNEGMFEAYLH